MKKRSPAETFELFFTARSPLFFLLGALALAIAGNMACNLLMAYFVDPVSPAKMTRMMTIFLSALVALPILVIVAHAMGAIITRVRRPILKPIVGSRKNALEVQRRGLVLTLTTNSLAPNSVARLTLERMKPEFVGFLGTAETEKAEVAATLKGEFNIPDDHYKSEHFDPVEIKDGVTKAEHVIDWMLKEHGLKADEIAMDITAGTATMSIAAFIAAEERHVDCQYIYSQFDRAKNQIIPGTQRPILITDYSALAQAAADISQSAQVPTLAAPVSAPAPAQAAPSLPAADAHPQAVVQTASSRDADAVQTITQKHE